MENFFLSPFLALTHPSLVIQRNFDNQPTKAICDQSFGPCIIRPETIQVRANTAIGFNSSVFPCTSCKNI